MKLLGARASLALAFTLYACVAPSVLAAPCARCSRGLRGQKQQRALRAQHKAAHHKAAAPKPEPPKAAPAAAPSANVTAEKQRDPPRHFLPVKDSYKLPRVAHDFHDELKATWGGLKARNIDAYEVKLVHRPKSEEPNDAVSEGAGYGMILALYSNDQETFDTLLDNAEKYMWNGRFHDWRVDVDGKILAQGAATDAEQDMAVTLVFAQHLVNRGEWKAHKTPQGSTYGERAQTMIDAMWSTQMIQDGKYVAPGAGWGGKSFVNPGYFSPAWYRVFQGFDANADEHDWEAVIDQSYSSILSSVGAARGLLPDWMTPEGGFVTESLGYNPYMDGQALFKDAIRVYWRLATDYMWSQDPRAKSFLESAYTFLQSKGGAPKANFFTMEGEELPQSDTWEFNGGQTVRHRWEHSHLTVGMWATAAICQGPAQAEPFADEMLKFYEGGDYWGNAVDVSGGQEDLEHNELYFDQFLAWFGAAMLSGYFVDVTQAV